MGAFKEIIIESLGTEGEFEPITLILVEESDENQLELISE